MPLLLNEIYPFTISACHNSLSLISKLKGWKVRILKRPFLSVKFYGSMKKWFLSYYPSQIQPMSSSLSSPCYLYVEVVAKVFMTKLWSWTCWILTKLCITVACWLWLSFYGSHSHPQSSQQEKGIIIQLFPQKWCDLLKIFNELISIDLENITVQMKH